MEKIADKGRGFVERIRLQYEHWRRHRCGGQQAVARRGCDGRSRFARRAGQGNPQATGDGPWTMIRTAR